MVKHTTDVVIDEPNAAPAPDADVVVLPEDGAEDGGETLPKRATLRPDGSVHLALRYPVTVKFKSGDGAVREETTSDLVLNRFKGADLVKMTECEKGEQTVTALALSTGTPKHRMQAIHDRMDGADIMAVAQVIGFFLPSGPKTGR